MSKRGLTPSFDRLYDCARALEGAELVLEVRGGAEAAGEGLWLVLRELAEGRAVHDIQVESTVDAAAALMIATVEAGAADV